MILLLIPWQRTPHVEPFVWFAFRHWHCGHWVVVVAVPNVGVDVDVDVIAMSRVAVAVAVRVGVGGGLPKIGTIGAAAGVVIVARHSGLVGLGLASPNPPCSWLALVRCR